MLFLKKVLVIVFLVSNASLVFAEKNFFSVDKFSSYIGFDFQNRNMRYKAGGGEELFRKNALQENIFFGLKFHDYVGLELGYEQTKRKQRDVIFHTGDSVLGTVVLPGDGPLAYKTQTKIRGWHLNLIGFLPLNEHREHLSLFASIGVVKLKLKLQRTLRVFRGGSFDGRVEVFDQNNSRYILRLTAGAQYLFTDNMGVRGLIAYEGTSRIKPQRTNNSGTVKIVEPVYSFMYGLGLFYKFW